MTDTKPEFTAEQLAKPLTRRDIPGLMKAVADVVRPLQSRVAELEAQIRDFKYVGAYQHGKHYHRGNFATHGGSLWHCNVATDLPPGDGTMWTLCAKRGKDGDVRRTATSHR